MKREGRGRQGLRRMRILEQASKSKEKRRGQEFKDTI